MKCRNVSEKLIAYREHALCVADELCIDIHLIQCEQCRDALDDLVSLDDLFSHIAVPEPDRDRLTRSLPDTPPPRPLLVLPRGNTQSRSPVRFALTACLFAVFAFTGFHAMLQEGGVASESAALRDLSSRSWDTTLRPWLKEPELAREFQQYTLKPDTDRFWIKD